MSLDEVKSKYDASRHPDVKSGLKTIEEARFGFFEMFTSFHNASNGFNGDKEVSMDEFMEYHQYLNVSFERDSEFKNFLKGVWNIDIKEISRNEYAG